MKHLWLKLIIFVGVILLGAFLVVRFQKQGNHLPLKQLKQPQQQEQEVPAVPWEEKVNAGDGTIAVIGRAQIKPDEPKTYEFFVAEIVDDEIGEETLVLTHSVGPETEMTIHHNAWSPNNKYFFLTETDGIGKSNYLVLKASGESFSEDEQYFDVGAIFEEKMATTGYTMGEATGWASPILLNVTTTKEDGAKGPSYWFDLTARTFWGHR